MNRLSKKTPQSKRKRDRHGLTESVIAQAVLILLDQQISLYLTNVYLGPNEIDLLIITHSKHLINVEIKLRRDDWMLELKKGTKVSNEHIQTSYYAVPVHLSDNIPDFVDQKTGIISVDQYHLAREVRKPLKTRCKPLSNQQVIELVDR